jgi:hypothetical protein
VKKKDNNLLWLFLLLGSASCLVFGLALKKSSSSEIENSGERKPSIRANSPEAQVLVNKHLWMAAKNQELTVEKIDTENKYLAPQVGETEWLRERSGSKADGVDHSADRFEGNATQDMNRFRYPKEYNFTNPDQIVQRQLFETEAQDAYDEAARKEYARQFVANARKQGYEIKLGPNYVVLSVRPINQERKPTLFEGSSGSQAQ